MIVGTGIDMVEVGRIEEFRRRRGERGLARLFTEAERSYCLGLAAPYPSLAARFAAKEAFFKALGTGYGRGGRWVDVEVQRDPLGKPGLRLHGRAARLAAEAGVGRVHLSLSHTDQHAIAYVVLEKVGGAGGGGGP